MDTSKKYINMCEKAKKLRELHKNGWMFTYFYCKKRKTVVRRCVLSDKELKKAIWLFESNHLQKLIIEWYITYAQMFIQLGNACSAPRERHAPYYNKMTSSEQLWLAFVMKERYDKHWSGKDWVKE